MGGGWGGGGGGGGWAGRGETSQNAIAALVSAAAALIVNRTPCHSYARPSPSANTYGPIKVRSLGFGRATLDVFQELLELGRERRRGLRVDGRLQARFHVVGLLKLL